MSWLADAIQRALTEHKGLAVGKLGTCEAETLWLYLHNYPYNWHLRMTMMRNAGLWPDSNTTLHGWAAHMKHHVLPVLDGVAAWYNAAHEVPVLDAYASQAHREAGLDWLNPWEWVSCIPADTKVAVVSPFQESIEQQIPHLNGLFPHPVWQDPPPTILPIKTGCSPVYDSISDAAWPRVIQQAGWKAAVNHIVEQVVASEARIALVGCGGLSLPIVAALKQRGIIAIHTGGTTQLAFGIRGGRWKSDPVIAPLMESPLWTNPRPSETPTHAKTIEGGCYWM